MSLRRLLPLLAAALLLGAGLWWWLAPTAFVVQVVAASPTEAVVLSRQNTDRSTSFWISLQATDGPVWVHRVPSGAWAVSSESLAISADRVAYLMLRDQQQVVVGLDRQTGEAVWETPLGEQEPPYLSSWLYANAQVVGDLLLVPYTLDGNHLAALSLADGALRWQQPMPQAASLPEVSESQVWLQSGDTLLSTLDLADGTTTLRSREMFNHCLLDGVVYTVQDDALVQHFPKTDSAPIPLPVEGARLKACGRADGAMILTLTVEDQTVLTRVSGGAVVQRLALAWPGQYGGPENRIARQGQRHHALKGEMPRFLPLMFSAMDPKTDTLRFIVVDLADMSIVAEATPRHDYLYFQQLRAGDTHYFWYHGGLNIAVDGTTGAISGTSRGGSGFDGRNVAGGVVWMGGEGSEGWRPPRWPAVAWLDARTLDVIGSSGETDAFQPAGADIAELTGWSVP